MYVCEKEVCACKGQSLMSSIVIHLFVPYFRSGEERVPFPLQVIVHQFEQRRILGSH